MPNIILSGEIGYDITPQYVREQLALNKGKDIDIHIASPGGFVYEGIEIYNLIRDFKRDNPESAIKITLKGQVMSMAAYISSVPAADLVAIEDNAVFMVHNPWTGGAGDYREFYKTGDILKGLAILIAESFAYKTKRDIKEMRQVLDDETYLFGEEIVKAGFADEVIKVDDQSKGRETRILEAKVRWDALQKKMEKEDMRQNLAKALYLLPNITDLIKPENPYANEHSARLRDPGDFAENPEWQDGKKGKFRRTTTKEYQKKKASKEFDVIWGKLKGKSGKDDPPIGQAIRFKKDKWTAAEAKKWLNDNDIKYILFEAASDESNQEYDPMIWDNNTASGGNNPEVIMDKKELQKNHADLYAEVIEAGKAEEKERVSKLMAMKKKPEFAKIPAVCEAIDKAISEGTSPEETMASVMAILSNPNIQAALESPDAIATGQEGATGSGEAPEESQNEHIRSMEV